jgi:hypothetical protein
MESNQDDEKETTKKHPIAEMADRIVLPGDIVGNLTEYDIHLGPGLLQDRDNIIVTKCGILRNPLVKYFWVESHQKRVGDQMAFC